MSAEFLESDEDGEETPEPATSPRARIMLVSPSRLTESRENLEGERTSIATGKGPPVFGAEIHYGDALRRERNMPTPGPAQEEDVTEESAAQMAADADICLKLISGPTVEEMVASMLDPVSPVKLPVIEDADATLPLPFREDSPDPEDPKESAHVNKMRENNREG